MRLQVSSSSIGPANYTVPFNPVIYDPADEPQIKDLKVLHGGSIWQKTPNDRRARVLRWEGNMVDHAKMSAMLTYFRSIEGRTRYIRFWEMADINNRWPDAQDWNKIKIINIKAEYRTGGTMQYEYLEIYIKPE